MPLRDVAPFPLVGLDRRTKKIRRDSGATQTLPCLSCRRHDKRRNSQQPGIRGVIAPLRGVATTAVRRNQTLPCLSRRRHDKRHNSQQPGIRGVIAQPGGFCKREARGVNLRSRPERRAQQGALRQSENAPCHSGKSGGIRRIRKTRSRVCLKIGAETVPPPRFFPLG